MRNTLTVDGTNLTTYGVYLSGHGTFGSPARAYNMLTVPGRDGSLVGPERRFENIEVSYPAFIFQSFDSNVSGLRNFLLSRDGYVKLVDSYHPGEYRMGVYRGPFGPSVVRTNDAGSFDLAFDCKPQRYLTSGDTDNEIPISSATFTITNPTQFNSRPFIEMKPRVYDTSVGTITINNTTITLTDIPANTGLFIDCEMMDCYDTAGNNYNSHITITGYDFPVFVPGSNSITRDTVGVLEIKGKWFIV